MDRIKLIWLILYPNAVSCCNGPSQPAAAESTIMSLDLFQEVAKRAKEESWACLVLCNADGIPEEYLTTCDEIGAEVVVPAECERMLPGTFTTVVFESNQMELVPKHPSTSRAIVRLQHRHIPQMSQIVSILLCRFGDVSIRHPELLQYTDQDMSTYRNELFTVGKWILDQKQPWTDYRLDCLTDRLNQPNATGECGAGFSSLAVGPEGRLYLCPAVLRDGGAECGDVLGHLELPNRHLLTREYSVPCGKCSALHCLRCVYLNKRSTFEYCVPPSVLCHLANIELEAQAWFAQEAIGRGQLKQTDSVPEPPPVYDPYELSRVAETAPITDVWRRLVKFDGRPENLRPSMMLDIIHGVEGWCEALTACRDAGTALRIDTEERDTLPRLRRRTIEQYRDTVFQDDCPTVREIEVSMCRAAEKFINFAISKPRQPIPEARHGN